MKTLAVVSLFILVLAAPARSEDGARGAFDSGDYAGAARQLESRLASSPPSAEGYFNLALALEKAGQPVPAALNYQRALRLDPGLAAARNGLALLATEQKIPPPPHGWTNDVQAVAHADVWMAAGTALAWAGAFALVFATQAATRRKGRTALASVVLIAGGVMAAVGWLSDARMTAPRPALVTAKEGADVLEAPADNSKAAMSLPAGALVDVLSPRGAWTYVALAGGVKGWVQTDRLTAIVPGEIF